MASSDTLANDESLPTILWNRRPVAKRTHSSDVSSDEGAGGDQDYFAASRLYEYRWPPEQERAELYFLQEQVAEFLRIRGIQRKYPDLVRRNVDVPEKKYLMHRGVVTETQSNMGLVAVRSEDVLEVMSEDFPDKYQEYMAVVQEREFQNTLQRRILETRKIALMREQQSWDGEDVRSVRSAALREMVEFNKRLALQRRQNHSTLHDRQTKISHVPRKALCVGSPPKLSRYPVALLPGQFSDYYHRYTPEELSALPLDTATKLPEKLPDAPHHQDSSTASQSTYSSTTVLQPSSASLFTSVTTTPPGTGSQQTAQTSASDAARLASITTTKVSQSGMVCSVCYRGRATVKQDKPEPLLQCSHCQGNIHPSCLGMSSEAAEVALTYPWQCLECKTCSVCGDPGGEEEMVFCDHCDRGYHTFCLDMKGIPEGQWLCMECCECAICGTESGRGDKNQWRHEFINNKFLHTLCLDCAKI